MENMNYQASFLYPPVWKRFVAYCIDLICIVLLSWLCYFLLQIFGFFIGILDLYYFIGRYWYSFLLPILVLLSYLYFTILPSSSFSSTFGQLFLGLKQVDKEGNPLTFGKANLKLLASFCSKILYIGYFIVFFNAYHQTFHEMITSTYLIERWKDILI